MITETQKLAADLAVKLRLGSWDGTIFRMDTFSAANHACSLHELGDSDRIGIKDSMDRFEEKHLDKMIKSKMRIG